MLGVPEEQHSYHKELVPIILKEGRLVYKNYLNHLCKHSTYMLHWVLLYKNKCVTTCIHKSEEMWKREYIHMHETEGIEYMGEKG